MTVFKSKNTDSHETHGIPEIPAVAHEFLKLACVKNDLPDSSLETDGLQKNKILTDLVNKYPQFFSDFLKIINSDHLNITSKFKSIPQAITVSGIEGITQIFLMHVIYLTLSQYKIKTIESKEFWQDVIRRAVSARLLGELSGLNAALCFFSGFMQDIGFILLFLEFPDKGVLWSEFHKREPDARYNMEQRIFKRTHEKQLSLFLDAWGLCPDLKEALCDHHRIDSIKSDGDKNKLGKVLNCADWISAVFTADDKSYVINRCRKLLYEQLNIESHRAESLLASIPEEVDLISSVMEIELDNHVTLSQILYQANIRLNEDNDQFQEITHRLDQAILERDLLAAELNRDLNMAREIQRSLLPRSRDENFPVHGINLSAKALSGDFFDFFEISNGDIYFNLGDVSGKGVNAALLMAKTSSLFRCLGKKIHQPASLLYEINNELCETSVHGMFVTMIAGIYKPQTNTIALVNAGNPPALLFTDRGVCREYGASAPPLGVISDITYTEYNIDLGSGSLYIYSDGVTEGYIDETTELGLSGLFKVIANMKIGSSVVDRLEKIVSLFTDTSSLRDDVTVLVVESAVIHEAS